MVDQHREDQEEDLHHLAGSRQVGRHESDPHDQGNEHIHGLVAAPQALPLLVMGFEREDAADQQACDGENDEHHSMQDGDIASELDQRLSEYGLLLVNSYRVQKM